MKMPAAPLSAHGGGVYSLIQCLSEMEKAAAGKALAKGGVKKQPLHLRLFEAIAFEGISDDSAAQARLNIPGGAQFSNLKRYLLSELLDTVTWQQRNKSTFDQLHFGLMQLRLLIERSQAGLARRYCQKLEMQAEASGHYGLMLELLYYKEQLIEQRSFRQYAGESELVATQIEQYTTLRQTEQQLRHCMNRLLLVRAENHLRIADEHDESMAESMLRLSALDEASGATPHLRLRYFTATALAAYMQQDFGACRAYCADALAMIELRPMLAQTDHDSFLSIANTALYCAFAQADTALASDWLKRFDWLALPAIGNIYFDKRWAIIHFNTTLKIAHKTGDYDSVARLVDEKAQAILEYNAQVLPPPESLSVIATVLISQFVLERYSRAEELMIELKERNRGTERRDIFYFTLVFHLMILYELKDWPRLDAATIAAYHVLYNRKQLRPFEKELMRFLKALPARRGNGEYAAFIRAFVARLEVYRADPVQRVYFLYFNYYDWLQSKLAGLSYRQYKQRLLSLTV